MKTATVYFPNLNGIRFIAALIVIIHHIEQFKFMFGLNNCWETSLVMQSIGKLGVILFFTLSGFLITYLLLVEEKQVGKIDIKQFYIRRILRIWPLYFLIFFLAFFVLNNINFFNLPNESALNASSSITFVLFVCFLSNIFLAFYGALPFASQSWSVATEEQFYLIWPWVLKFSKSKLLSLILVIVVVCGVNIFLMTNLSNSLPFKQELLSFWKMFNIDCMATGGIFAYFLFTGAKILKYVMNVYVFYFALLSMIILLAFKIYIPIFTTYFNYDIWALLFGLVILNFSSAKNLGISLENKVFNYLGKISYGLYMYHSIAILISIKVLILFSTANNILIFITSLGITILMAHLSYFYFENMFLKLKHRFTRVPSGPN